VGLANASGKAKFGSASLKGLWGVPMPWEDYRDPYTGERLSYTGNDVLASTSNEFSVVRGIPRFVPLENYAASFGYQWQRFSKTQLDSRASWGGQSGKRLLEETGWPSNLNGQRILEAGSGMGRFTEVLARSGARVFTFDYSTAIDANYENNRAFENVSFAQADIYHPPYEPGSFDKVLCLGVLQHCPSPKRAFLKLTKFLRPGGEIVIDVYRLSWKSLLQGKYYLRALTSWIPPEPLAKCVKSFVGLLYPATGLIHSVDHGFARRLSLLFGMADYRGVFDADDAALRELAELDTFDMLAPAYDRPQTLGAVSSWFREAGLVDVRIRPGYNGIEAKGKRTSTP
jgi:2-polyprenyl-3-methyl-5-hydroxy-6-metoxy-1,4-benzoquinol methylase